MISIDPTQLPQMTHNLILLAAYFLIGASVKYIDQAFDYKVFSKKTATLLAAPTAAAMGALMVYDDPSASIFMAIALGVAVANKIDNIAFRVGIGTLILIPIFFSDIVTILWLPFGLLFLSAAADEFGNDWSDKYQKEQLKKRIQNKKTNPNLKLKTASYFFSQRGTLKTTMAALVIANQMGIIYLIALLLFDVGYGITEKISFQLKPNRLKDPNKRKTTKKAESPQDSNQPAAYIQETPAI